MLCAQVRRVVKESGVSVGRSVGSNLTVKQVRPSELSRRVSSPRWLVKRWVTRERRIMSEGYDEPAPIGSSDIRVKKSEYSLVSGSGRDRKKESETLARDARAVLRGSMPLATLRSIGEKQLSGASLRVWQRKIGDIENSITKGSLEVARDLRSQILPDLDEVTDFPDWITALESLLRAAVYFQNEEQNYDVPATASFSHWNQLIKDAQERERQRNAENQIWPSAVASMTPANLQAYQTQEAMAQYPNGPTWAELMHSNNIKTLTNAEKDFLVNGPILSAFKDQALELKRLDAYLSAIDNGTDAAFLAEDEAQRSQVIQEALVQRTQSLRHYTTLLQLAEDALVREYYIQKATADRAIKLQTSNSLINALLATDGEIAQETGSSANAASAPASALPFARLRAALPAMMASSTAKTSATSTQVQFDPHELSAEDYSLYKQLESTLVSLEAELTIEGSESGVPKLIVPLPTNDAARSAAASRTPAERQAKTRADLNRFMTLILNTKIPAAQLPTKELKFLVNTTVPMFKYSEQVIAATEGKTEVPQTAKHATSDALRWTPEDIQLIANTVRAEEELGLGAGSLIPTIYRKVLSPKFMESLLYPLQPVEKALLSRQMPQDVYSYMRNLQEYVLEDAEIENKFDNFERHPIAQSLLGDHLTGPLAVRGEDESGVDFMARLETAAEERYAKFLEEKPEILEETQRIYGSITETLKQRNEMAKQGASLDEEMDELNELEQLEDLEDDAELLPVPSAARAAKMTNKRKPVEEEVLEAENEEDLVDAATAPVGQADELAVLETEAELLKDSAEPVDTGLEPSDLPTGTLSDLAAFGLSSVSDASVAGRAASLALERKSNKKFRLLPSSKPLTEEESELLLQESEAAQAKFEKYGIVDKEVKELLEEAAEDANGTSTLNVSADLTTTPLYTSIMEERKIIYDSLMAPHRKDAQVLHEIVTFLNDSYDAYPAWFPRRIKSLQQLLDERDTTAIEAEVGLSAMTEADPIFNPLAKRTLTSSLVSLAGIFGVTDAEREAVEKQLSEVTVDTVSVHDFAPSLTSEAAASASATPSSFKSSSTPLTLPSDGLAKEKLKTIFGAQLPAYLATLNSEMTETGEQGALDAVALDEAKKQAHKVMLWTDFTRDQSGTTVSPVADYFPSAKEHPNHQVSLKDLMVNPHLRRVMKGLSAKIPNPENWPASFLKVAGMTLPWKTANVDPVAMADPTKPFGHGRELYETREEFVPAAEASHDTTYRPYRSPEEGVAYNEDLFVTKKGYEDRLSPEDAAFLKRELTGLEADVDALATQGYDDLPKARREAVEQYMAEHLTERDMAEVTNEYHLLYGPQRRAISHEQRQRFHRTQEFLKEMREKYEEGSLAVPLWTNDKTQSSAYQRTIGDSPSSGVTVNRASALGNEYEDFKRESDPFIRLRTNLQDGDPLATKHSLAWMTVEQEKAALEMFPGLSSEEEITQVIRLNNAVAGRPEPTPRELVFTKKRDHVPAPSPQEIHKMLEKELAPQEKQTSLYDYFTALAKRQFRLTRDQHRKERLIDARLSAIDELLTKKTLETMEPHMTVRHKQLLDKLLASQTLSAAEDAEYATLNASVQAKLTAAANASENIDKVKAILEDIEMYSRDLALEAQMEDARLGEIDYVEKVVAASENNDSTKPLVVRRNKFIATVLRGGDEWTRSIVATLNTDDFIREMSKAKTYSMPTTEVEANVRMLLSVPTHIFNAAMQQAAHAGKRAAHGLAPLNAINLDSSTVHIDRLLAKLNAAVEKSKEEYGGRDVAELTLEEFLALESQKSGSVSELASELAAIDKEIARQDEAYVSQMRERQKALYEAYKAKVAEDAELGISEEESAAATPKKVYGSDSEAEFDKLMQSVTDQQEEIDDLLLMRASESRKLSKDAYNDAGAERSTTTLPVIMSEVGSATAPEMAAMAQRLATKSVVGDAPLRAAVDDPLYGLDASNPLVQDAIDSVLLEDAKAGRIFGEKIESNLSKRRAELGADRELSEFDEHFEEVTTTQEVNLVHPLMKIDPSNPSEVADYLATLPDFLFGEDSLTIERLKEQVELQADYPDAAKSQGYGDSAQIMLDVITEQRQRLKDLSIPQLAHADPTTEAYRDMESRSEANLNEVTRQGLQEIRDTSLLEYETGEEKDYLPKGLTRQARQALVTDLFNGKNTAQALLKLQKTGDTETHVLQIGASLLKILNHPKASEGVKMVAANTLHIVTHPAFFGGDAAKAQRVRDALPVPKADSHGMITPESEALARALDDPENEMVQVLHYLANEGRIPEDEKTATMRLFEELVLRGAQEEVEYQKWLASLAQKGDVTRLTRELTRLGLFKQKRYKQVLERFEAWEATMRKEAIEFSEMVEEAVNNLSQSTDLPALGLNDRIAVHEAHFKTDWELLEAHGGAHEETGVVKTRSADGRLLWSKALSPAHQSQKSLRYFVHPETGVEYEVDLELQKLVTDYQKTPDERFKDSLGPNGIDSLIESITPEQAAAIMESSAKDFDSPRFGVTQDDVANQQKYEQFYLTSIRDLQPVDIFPPPRPVPLPGQTVDDPPSLKEYMLRMATITTPGQAAPQTPLERQVVWRTPGADSGKSFMNAYNAMLEFDDKVDPLPALGDHWNLTDPNDPALYHWTHFSRMQEGAMVVQIDPASFTHDGILFEVERVLCILPDQAKLFLSEYVLNKFDVTPETGGSAESMEKAEQLLNPQQELARLLDAYDQQHGHQTPFGLTADSATPEEHNIIPQGHQPILDMLAEYQRGNLNALASDADVNLELNKPSYPFLRQRVFTIPTNLLLSLKRVKWPAPQTPKSQEAKGIFYSPDTAIDNGGLPLSATPGINLPATDPDQHIQYLNAWVQDATDRLKMVAQEQADSL